jgi:hypothetical protein
MPQVLLFLVIFKRSSCIYCLGLPQATILLFKPTGYIGWVPLCPLSGWDGASLALFWGWPQNAVYLIPTSQVAGLQAWAITSSQEVDFQSKPSVLNVVVRLTKVKEFVLPTRNNLHKTKQNKNTQKCEKLQSAINFHPNVRKFTSITFITFEL